MSGPASSWGPASRALVTARRGSRDSKLFSPPLSPSFGEPLEPIYFEKPAPNKFALLRNLIVMGLLSAAFIGAGLFADFVSTVIQFP